MSSISTQPSALSSQPTVNVADRLATIAQRQPDAVAVAVPGRGDVSGQNSYSTCTFAELDRDASALARGLVEMGVQPGTRLVLLVRPGCEFVKLVFALLRSGATTVLIDPGMGRKHLVKCLAAVEPEGFVAISSAQAVRTVLRRRFSRCKLNVTVGRRWFWGGKTYEQLLQLGRKSTASLPTTCADDAAAIIYTSGSTGPPKGVLYTHEMFDTQVAEIGGHYDIRPGGFDLACFPLFGLFNSAMGVTTVFPDMDFSRPASADPTKLLAAANDWHVTQAFASPAVWSKLSQYCETHGEQIPTLRKVFSCGAPVPAKVLKRTLACVSADAEMHTPYGATECLPIATIEAAEVLGETRQRTDGGAGVCVGRKFGTIDWRVIRIIDEPIALIDECEELPEGEIGELIVRGPQVSPKYNDVSAVGNDSCTDVEFASNTSRSSLPTALTHNAIAKIPDGNTLWHRMGDVGYFDEQGRFWYCG
ncbi:MAG: AMP-binding protein, partial [Planctomycetes bacterium]|nr:AMP-binding protein [Planctomycetota bacterium]